MSSPVDIFRRLTNGVYVIGVYHEGRRNAFTAAWLTQVSFEPLLILLSVNPGHASLPLLRGAGGFAVSVLPADGIDLAAHFGTQSGRSVDKLAGQRYTTSPRGFPVLARAIGWLECAVTNQVPAGDHLAVFARATSGELLRPGDAPLRYADTGNLDGSAALFPAAF